MYLPGIFESTVFAISIIFSMLNYIMKLKTVTAFGLLAIGLMSVIDWIIFSTRPANEKLDWDTFKIKYIQHLPKWLQPLYANPLISTTILLLLFLASGVLFLKAQKKSKLYLILAVFSFVLAFWQLFSLM